MSEARKKINTYKMGLTICGIKLSENGMLVCVAVQIWVKPKSNPIGRVILLQGPGWNVIDEKEAWAPVSYISITTERTSRENGQTGKRKDERSRFCCV